MCLKIIMLKFYLFFICCKTQSDNEIGKKILNPYLIQVLIQFSTFSISRVLKMLNTKFCTIHPGSGRFFQRDHFVICFHCLQSMNFHRNLRHKADCVSNFDKRSLNKLSVQHIQYPILRTSIF